MLGDMGADRVVVSSTPNPFVTHDNNTDLRRSESYPIGITVSHPQSVSCSTGIDRRSPSTALQTQKVAVVS